MAKENLVGQTVAGYAIQELVGEGGTSVVYRASHPDHGTVAFKVLRDKLRQDKTALARFTREANFGKRVTHPNVIRTIETGQADGLPYLVIEWAEGDLLERYAKRNAPMPREEVANIVLQIADAVGAAHESGIVHRDLKPDNAMYDPATGKVKLLDFGIAAATDTSQDERLTRAGYFVGTLMYVAPEALSGALVTPAADQYSLATIAYLLLTGTLPYLAKSPREMFTQLLSQPPIPLNSARPNLDFGARVESTVMRALAREPAERYPDVLVFARELHAALTSPATPATSPGGGGGGAGGAPEEGLFSRMKGLFRRPGA
ncbi:MAG TPA: serine/threonine-protein kinase [Gemmatimonadaceae bacterium]|nr:serine/threonine-protein kinase [Gemmatimonadaceae bacterium]